MQQNAALPCLCQEGPTATLGCGKWSFSPLCWTLRNHSQTSRGAGLTNWQSCSTPGSCMIGSAKEGRLLVSSACQHGRAVAEIPFSSTGTCPFVQHTNYSSTLLKLSLNRRQMREISVFIRDVWYMTLAFHKAFFIISLNVGFNNPRLALSISFKWTPKGSDSKNIKRWIPYKET